MRASKLPVIATIFFFSTVYFFLVFIPVYGSGGNYWLVSAGRRLPESIEGEDNQEFDFNRGEMYSIAWGGQVDALRVEYRFSGAHIPFKSLTEPAETKSASGRLNTYTLSLNFFERRSIPFSGNKLRGFWSLGFGASLVELSNLRTDASSLYDDSDGSIYYRWGIGLEYELNDSSFIVLSGEKDSTESLDFTNKQTGESVSFDNLNTETLILEYRWLY